MPLEVYRTISGSSILVRNGGVVKANPREIIARRKQGAPHRNRAEVLYRCAVASENTHIGREVPVGPNRNSPRISRDQAECINPGVRADLYVLGGQNHRMPADANTVAAFAQIEFRQLSCGEEIGHAL